MYEEKRDMYARLKACITRQRISFRLFKQWYWESFDEDVQVRRCDVPLPTALGHSAAHFALYL